MQEVSWEAVLALSMLLLYTTEDAHLVMPSLPASICAQQRELSSKIKTESKPSLPDCHQSNYTTLQTVLLTCVLDCALDMCYLVSVQIQRHNLSIVKLHERIAPSTFDCAK